MQRRQQEQEVTFIQNKEDKENSIAKNAATESSIKKSLYMRTVVPGGDHIPHSGRENFAFRLPTQTNLP